MFGSCCAFDMPCSASTEPMPATGCGTGTGAGAGIDVRGRAPPAGVELASPAESLDAGGEGPPSISSRSSLIVVSDRPNDAGSIALAGSRGALDAPLLAASDSDMTDVACPGAVLSAAASVCERDAVLPLSGLLLEPAP